MELLKQLASLSTERINPATVDIDQMTSRELVAVINAQDATVAAAVAAELDAIAAAVDVIETCFRNGGSLFYVGAGTSGRLGIVDASECPPTYGTPPAMVQAIIAGGEAAVFASQEGVEDRREAGAQAIRERQVGQFDVVCGIAASGRTPFVLGALAEAGALGARTILVATNPRSIVETLAPEAELLVCPDVGPEVVAGSTRMKSGTAQKMVLNMLTTAAMIRIGKTYGNVMVDLQQTNEKLKARSVRTLQALCSLSAEAAEAALDAAGGHVKTAVVMVRLTCSREEAFERLEAAGGHVRIALGNAGLSAD
jgi:N-acetylmuramic acid 6-phosphate etherase